MARLTFVVTQVGAQVSIRYRRNVKDATASLKLTAASAETAANKPTDGDKDTAVHYSENETCLPAMAMAAVPRCGFAGEPQAHGFGAETGHECNGNVEKDANAEEPHVGQHGGHERVQHRAHDAAHRGGGAPLGRR